MSGAASTHRRVGWWVAVGVIVLVVIGVGIGKLLTNAGGRQEARRASLPNVQRTIRAVVPEGVAGSPGVRGGSARHRTVAVDLPVAPARSYSTRLSGSAALNRSYPRLESGASARARIRFVPLDGRSYGRVCWQMSAVRSREAVASGAMYQAPRGLEGPRVIVLESSPGASWREQACALVYSSLMLEIARHPAGFYIQLDTARHPAGAVRGQL